MPRVLVLCEYPTLNGGERSLLAVLPAMQRAGWEFEAFCPPTGPLAEAFQWHQVCLAPFSASDLRAVLGSRLGSRRYDLVHANSLTTGRLSGPIVAEAVVPSIAHLRDIVGLKAAAVADLQRHSRLIAVSEETRDYHVAQGLDKAKVRVVYNGVDLRLFAPRGRNRNQEAARTIGIMGQIILRKGQDVALAASVAAMRTRPDVDVVVLGARHSEKPETREYEHRLHQMVADAAMTDRIHFLGTRDDVAELLPAFTLLLHTPRQEPLGRVLLEAAACGVPVVATDVGGTREIFPGEVEDGAILTPVDDVAAAQRAVETVLDDDALRVCMATAGRRRAEAAFSVERAAAELLRHYNEVAQIGHGDRRS